MCRRTRRLCAAGVLVLCWLQLSCTVRAQSSVHLQVVENSITGFVVGTVFQDTSTNSNFRFTGDDDCSTYFNIHPDSSQVTVRNQSNLDREQITQLNNQDMLNCFVSYDATEESITTPSQLRVDIEILDLNDRRPYFFGLSQPHNFLLRENTAIPAAFLTLQPTDEDNGVNGTTHFSITRGNEDNYFEIDLAEGDMADSTNNRELILIRELNFESLPNNGSFNLTITITDMGPNPLSYQQLVNIEVENLEDDPPTFDSTSYVFNITENYPSEEVFAHVRAEGQVVYNICMRCTHVPEDAFNIIGVNQTTGGLFLRQPVDYETFHEDKEIRIEVTATNQNTRESPTTRVTVGIIDVNENPPLFYCQESSVTTTAQGCSQVNVNNSELYIVENSVFTGYPIILRVRDNDQTGNFKNVTDPTLVVNPEVYTFYLEFARRGVGLSVGLKVNGSIDREINANYTLTLAIENTVSPALRTLTTMHIRILDINDNIPSFEEEGEYEGYVFEGSPVGMEVLRVQASDPDEGENGTVTYSISNVHEELARDWFHISPESGRISVRNTSINYLAVGGSVTLNITASDSGTPPLSTSTLVVISVLPSASFIAGSYQKYFGAEVDLVSRPSTNFYLEFRSSERNGLLAYQHDPSTGGTFAVELRQGGVVVQSGDLWGCGDTEVTTGRWHSLLVERNSQMLRLTVSEVNISSDAPRLAFLQELNIQRCVNTTAATQQLPDHGSSLYLGGVNIFALPPNATLQTPRFVGGIRNVVVGDVRLDPTCLANEVGTLRGDVSGEGCEEMSCTSNRSSQCAMDTEGSYCQCLGGFSSQVCKATETESYAPIRFHGTTMVHLSLGYSFFYDLEVQRTTGLGGSVPGEGDGVPELGTGAGRARRDVSESSGGQSQVVEVQFKLVNLRNAVILHSTTSSSIHLIRIENHEQGEDTASLQYSIWEQTQTHTPTPLLHLSIDDFPFQTQEEYSLRIIMDARGVTLSFSDRQAHQVWGEGVSRPMPCLAQQPQTQISIGGASNSLNGSYGHFMGCIGRVSIDGVELPLSGLLRAGSEQGGFEIEDSGVNGNGGVIGNCDLCDINVCPDHGVCSSDRFGDVVCICLGGRVLSANGKLCEFPPKTPPTVGISSASPFPVSYVAGGAGVGLLVLVGVITILIIVFVRRWQEKKRSYRFNNNPMTNGYTHPKSPSSGNQYTPTIPKRRPSLTSQPTTTTNTTPGCLEADERGSSVSTFQEHDGDPESPARHSHAPGSSRTRHASVESGIKTDMDQEPSLGGCGHGIPQMEDSGHEVNSTDSGGRSLESEDVASSCCYNEQGPPPSSRLRIMVGSPKHHKCSSPVSPLTPKEQKIRIPLRPESTNLSQSEFGDERTDTEGESFRMRASSSSGTRRAEPHQGGRGYDSENSKSSGCSTPQWYKSSTTSDTERENERVQATRPYYPLHHPAHHSSSEPRGNHYQPRFKPGGGAVPPPPPPPHPPMYYSPPTFSDHISGAAYSRPRSKSMHTPATANPAAKLPPMTNTPSPRRYENYPGQRFPREREGVRFAYEPSYETHSGGPRPRHDRQLSDPRALEESYSPASFTRQYSDPRIPQNGTFCIPRKQHEPKDQGGPLHVRQMSDPRVSSQQTQDSLFVQPAPHASRSLRHITSPSYSSSSSSNHRNTSGSNRRSSRKGESKDQRAYYTLDRMIPDHVRYTPNQPGRSFSSGDTVAPGNGEEPSFQTLNHISRIDPISNYEAQDRMKIAVDHMDPLAYHLLSGPCMQFEDVSTDPSVNESQLTTDESIMGEQQVFESQGGGEGTADMLDPLDMRLARLREDEIDSILTDSEIGKHMMNHFPSADCSSQYTATIVAGSTSTSGESTPKMQKVFVIPPSQQSFDV